MLKLFDTFSNLGNVEFDENVNDYELFRVCSFSSECIDTDQIRKVGSFENLNLQLELNPHLQTSRS